MREQLEQIKVNALAALEAAANPAALEELRVKLLGKKGEMTAVEYCESISDTLQYLLDESIAQKAEYAG